MRRLVPAAPAVRGTITPPGDKSISHRAAILNAIAEGEATVENFQRGADTLATLRCLRLLGVQWRWRDESTLVIRGGGLHGLREPEDVLDCRNSGTTMRLLAGLLAPQPFLSVLSGDASLRSRPMGRIIQPLRLMSADIRGRADDTRAPLVIRGGPLKGIRYRLPVASAQLKSALILAGLYASGETVLEEPAPSRDHTERMLAAMGAQVERGEGLITVRPLPQAPSPFSLRVPGDLSAAAYWIVLAVLHPQAEIRVRDVGVNPTRTGLLEALHRMGADVHLENQRLEGPEPVADIVARSSRLRGTIIGGDLIPRAIDELPLLALAASLARGETLIRDAAELRTKESDRISSAAQELRRLGADLDEMPDGLRIRGVSSLRGATVSSHGDHRMAMTLAIAGILATGETIIRNSGVVAVSYPRFWRDLDLLAGR